MRFLDVAASVATGLVVLSFVAVWNPQTFSDNSARFQREMGLRSQLLRLVSERGLYWFSASGSSQVCSYLMSVSNSTVEFSASFDGKDCFLQHGTVEADLPLHLGQREVTLEAWLKEG